MARHKSIGAQDYEDLAEELSDPEAKLEDFQAEVVASAKAYAKRAHKKWPPRPTTSGWQVTIFSTGGRT